MGFLSELSELISLTANAIPTESSARSTLTNAKCNEIHSRHQSDKAAEMELIMEKETDPLIKKKLEKRLNDNVYEWEDLYK